MDNAGGQTMERDDRMTGSQRRTMQFPSDGRSKILEEFAAFARKYADSKTHLQQGDLLDAFMKLQEALKHWARLVIFEDGKEPGEAVWSQIHKINAGVYKLNEELVMSKETLEQRIQLVLLACEFSLMSKMEKCCAPLIGVLKSRAEPWSIAELQEHPELARIRNELTLVLNKLVQKSLIREVAVIQGENIDHLDIRYIA
jgi:hypothetical protein